MICQFLKTINHLSKDFWTIPLDDFYKKLNELVRNRRIRFYIPSVGRCSQAGNYILWGTYTRDRIIDIKLKSNEDEVCGYEEVLIQDFKIQRIRDKQTNKTHAILSEFFVPYKQYSLRFILFHLKRFFNQFTTQEAYCLEAEIEVKTFRQWLKWLKDHIAILCEFGLTGSYQDNWHSMREWILKITDNVSDEAYNSLKKINRALFQDRRMPENTKYHNYVRPG